ncbi:MAG: hypothetical protein CXX72_00175, partial [Methanobacteriota archaeon]
MADCDVCGASDVDTRSVRRHGALLDVCGRCQDRMGLTPDEIRDANLVREHFQRSAASRRGSLKAGRAGHGTDLMAASEVELVGDFAARIRKGR